MHWACERRRHRPLHDTQSCTGSPGGTQSNIRPTARAGIACKESTLEKRSSVEPRDSGFLYGSGRNSTGLVTLKIAVLAPMLRAMVVAAATVKRDSSSAFALRMRNHATAFLQVILLARGRVSLTRSL